MRSDNLGPHLQHRHKITSKSERESIVKASKLVKRELDSDEKPRRRSRRESNIDSTTAIDEQLIVL